MVAPEALELADRVPQPAPEQPTPDRLQLTPVFWGGFVMVAKKLWVPAPASTLAVDGVTVTEIVGGVTVRVVDPLTPPVVAWIVEDPTPFAAANPEALIKSAGFEELQVTEFVRFCVEPSL
jgi:hypothetical protein